MNVRFTLVADGPSDSALMPILTKLLRADPRVTEIDGQFAHPTMLPRVREGLAARAVAALSLFPANLLFVHRDAERERHDVRRQEIMETLRELLQVRPFVPVVPVRMTEAWLLFDESAIRTAAGNPRGRTSLNLPRLQDLESITDPKSSLYLALRTACELHGRALTKFNTREAARVADLIDDFSPLSGLVAFQCLRQDLLAVLDRIADN
ncbi:MAG: hypothetical protein HY736_24275 [Verrucomicrobia bacterium]|nr:hypothetical protein [Verrucomicrobiota bacterium]